MKASLFELLSRIRSYSDSEQFELVSASVTDEGLYVVTVKPHEEGEAK